MWPRGNHSPPRPDGVGPDWLLVAAHVVRRIAGPALPADVVVEPAVTVSYDVEPGKLLVAQIAGQRVDVLLAVAAADHRIEEHAGAEISVYQLGRGSEPVIVVGSMMSLVPRYIVDISQDAKRDFGFSQAGGIAYRLSANSKKSRGSGGRAPTSCAQSGWAIAPMGDGR